MPSPRQRARHGNPAKSKASSHSTVRLISSRTAYRGPVFWVSTDEVQEPGGIRTRRDIIHHTGSIVVLAVDDSKRQPRILLERQYRHAAKDYLWELPAGRIDPGEKELAAARRELLEETGYSAARWRRILKFYASPGFVAETMAIFLATQLRAGVAQPEADEMIEVRFLTLPAAVKMVLSGAIRDAKTIAGVLWLDHQIVNRQILDGPIKDRQIKNRQNKDRQIKDHKIKAHRIKNKLGKTGVRRRA